MHILVPYSANPSDFVLWGASVFHSRVIVDILSTFLSFLSPGIAIDIPRSAVSFLVKGCSLQFIFKVSPPNLPTKSFCIIAPQDLHFNTVLVLGAGYRVTSPPCKVKSHS